MNLQKVEMYLDKGTGKWVLKHQDYTENFYLEAVLQNHFGRDEGVEINFTGFKQTQGVDSEEPTVSKNRVMLKQKGLREVTGEEATYIIENGGKLWYSAKLDKYLSKRLFCGELEFVMTLGIDRIEDSIPTENTLETIASKQWVVKENPLENPKIVMRRSIKFVEVTGNVALIHLRRGIKLFYQDSSQTIWMENRGDREIIVTTGKEGMGTREYHKETIESVFSKQWLILEEDYETA
ncbi:hypothetical protein ACQUY5_30240 [Bacillus cereus]|uniref:hypothetical protein n=1 Tax=Bacillus cereus TaxID=1396 RepID=UPI003D184B53